MPNRTLDILLTGGGDNEIPILRALLRAGYDPRMTRADTGEEMRRALSEGRWDAIVAGNPDSGFSCERALEVLRETDLDIPFIPVSAVEALPPAIETEMRGAEERRGHKRRETQLRQAAAMEAMGRLAGGVAHDLNNLLTVISGFAQLALMDKNPARAGLEQISIAAERAAQLTRQLLAFSRRQTLRPVLFDLNRLIGELEPSLKRVAGENVLFTMRLSAEPVHVKADPGQTEQALFNLVVNARDAMPGGGKLILATCGRSLEAPEALTYGLQEGEYCVVSVTDTGAAIPADMLAHIFEPFFKFRPEGQEAGLRLATVYGLAGQSGGAIHAQSGQSTGTSVIVFLPRAAAEAQLEKTSAGEAFAA